jgi:hypothetical protein
MYEVTRRRERRRKKLLDDLKDRRADSVLDRCTGWQRTEWHDTRYCKEWHDTRYCKYTIVLLKMSTAMLENMLRIMM